MNITDKQLSDLLLGLHAPEECALLGEPGAIECLLHLHHSPEAANFLERMEDEPELRAAFRKIQDEMGEMELGDTAWRPDVNVVPEEEEKLGIVVGGFGFAEDRISGPSETYRVESLKPIENLSASLTDFGDRVLVEITSPEECGAAFVGKVVRWRIGKHLGELSLKSADFDSVKASVYVNEPWSDIVALKKDLKRFWLLA